MIYPWIFALLVTAFRGFHVVSFKNTGVLFIYNRLAVFFNRMFFSTTLCHIHHFHNHIMTFWCNAKKMLINYKLWLLIGHYRVLVEAPSNKYLLC